MSRGVTASQLAETYGMTARHWTRMATLGKIPGAWQPSGERGKWLFDPDAFARWKRAQHKEVSTWQGFTNGGIPGGAVPSVRGRNIADHSAPRIDALLKSVCKTG